MSLATLIQGLIVLTLPWLGIEVFVYFLHQFVLNGKFGSSIFRFYSNLRTNVSSNLTIDRGSLWLKVESTAFNSLPERILKKLFGTSYYSSSTNLSSPSLERDDLFESSRQKKSNYLFRLYDFGIVFATFALLASLAVILWGTFALIGDIVSLNESKQANPIIGSEGLVSLQKRYLTLDTFDNTPISLQNQRSSWSPQLKPLIPGLTLPWNHLFPFLLALCITQVVHEAGHAICGSLHDLGPIRMGLLVLYPLIPGAFVVLPKEASRVVGEQDLHGDDGNGNSWQELERGVSNDEEGEEDSNSSSFAISSREKMRIISAGVWHNALTAFLLAPLLFLSFGKLVHGTFWYDSGAIRVFNVQPSSPLAIHLSSGAVITHLDDVDLTESRIKNGEMRMAKWNQYLSYTEDEHQSQETSQGWCVPLASWQTSPSDCCKKYAKAESTDETNSTGLDNNLCFFNVDNTQHRCYDPSTLIEGRARRCQSSCSTSEAVENDSNAICIRLDQREQLLRITVQDGTQAGQRVVLFQGDRNAIFLAMDVSPYLFRFCSTCFWPKRIFDWVSLTFEYTLTLSVAMALFNMLPLPSLDGDVFLIMLFAYWLTLSHTNNQDREQLRGESEEFQMTAQNCSQSQSRNAGHENVNDPPRSRTGMGRVRTTSITDRQMHSNRGKHNFNFRFKVVAQIHSRIRMATLALTVFVLGGSIVLHVIESN